jgi:hypothetical protein
MSENNQIPCIMKTKNCAWTIKVSLGLLLLSLLFSCRPDRENSSGHLYDLGTGLQSLSVSFENPTGGRGAGGKKASSLGVGRKGFPAKGIAPGETVELCNLDGLAAK